MPVIVAAAADIDDDPAAWEFGDGSVTVRCVDRDGQSVAGAELEFGAWIYDDPPETRRPVLRARTNANGMHTFEGLSGLLQYAVHAQRGDIGCWNVELGLRPSAKHRTVTLTLGVYNSVSGRVIDMQGAPVEGVRIANRGVLEGAVTDPDGKFRIPHLTDQQEFRFYKPAYGWINSGLSPVVHTLEIRLPDGGLCEITVVDADQKPVAGAKVTYQGGNAYYGGGSIGGAITDANGKAVSTWLPANSTTDVFAYYERDGYAWSAKATPMVRAGETTKVTLEPKATVKMTTAVRPDTGAVETTYVRLDAPKGVVSGKVVMADSGEPVIASILYDASREWVDDAKGSSNEDGTFRIEGIAPGAYYFTAFPMNPALYHSGGLIQVTVADDKPVEDLTFRIEKGCTIRGDVKSADGLPVPNLEIGIEPRDFGHYIAYWTDARGHFFLPHLACVDGPFTVRATGPRGQTVSASVGPLEPGTISEPVVLTVPDLYLAEASAGSVRGVVVDENSEPVPGATVSLPPNIAPEPATTDDTGAFVLPVRGAGNASFAVTMDHTLLLNNVIESETTECEILAGRDIAVTTDSQSAMHTIRVRAPRPKPVGGTVVDENGAPLDARMEVYVDDCQGSGHAQGGNFLKLGCMKPFTEGPVLLEFTLEGYQARVIESGRDFELGDTNIRVVMKRGPFEPFTSVFQAVTGCPVGEAETMFKSDRILDRCGEYWSLAGGPARGGRPPIMLVVTDENGKPVTTIRTQPFMGPTVHSAQDEEAYAEHVVTLTNDAGHYTLEQGHVFVWADGKAKVFLPSPERNRMGEPECITLVPQATLTVEVVNADGTPMKGAVVSLSPEDKDWPRYIDSAPPHIKTDASGTKQFTKLPAGAYTVYAHLSGWLGGVDAGDEKIQLVAGENKRVKIVLKPVS